MADVLGNWSAVLYAPFPIPAWLLSPHLSGIKAGGGGQIPALPLLPLGFGRKPWFSPEVSCTPHSAISLCLISLLASVDPTLLGPLE